MNPAIFVSVVAAGFSALAAALSSVALAYIASIDRRVGVLESHAINKGE